MEWASFYSGVARGLATILGTPDESDFSGSRSHGGADASDSNLCFGGGGLTREERQVEDAIMSQSKMKIDKKKPKWKKDGDSGGPER